MEKQRSELQKVITKTHHHNNQNLAIKKNPPHLTTQLFMGQYTASFKLTPTRYAAIEEGILAAHRQRATSPMVQHRESPKALPLANKDSPLVINEEGVLFPFTALQKSPIASVPAAAPFQGK